MWPRRSAGSRARTRSASPTGSPRRGAARSCGGCSRTSPRAGRSAEICRRSRTRASSTNCEADQSMKAIIIGAGRGSRLGPETDEVPKTLVPVMGRPMLDWILEALEEAGFSGRDIVFVSGYREEVVRERYPQLTFVRNERWEHNNILASLLCARAHLADGFVSTYADIVYDGAIARRVAQSAHDITLGCDTAWR